MYAHSESLYQPRRKTLCKDIQNNTKLQIQIYYHSLHECDSQYWIFKRFLWCLYSPVQYNALPPFIHSVNHCKTLSQEMELGWAGDYLFVELQDFSLIYYMFTWWSSIIHFILLITMNVTDSHGTHVEGTIQKIILRILVYSKKNCDKLLDHTCDQRINVLLRVMMLCSTEFCTSAVIHLAPTKRSPWKLAVCVVKLI